MSYDVELSEAAIKDLKKLDTRVGTRILKKLRWLGKNFEAITPQALSANLSGLFKLRVGDYRVIDSFDAELSVISVERVGHRRDVYE